MTQMTILRVPSRCYWTSWAPLGPTSGLAGLLVSSARQSTDAPSKLPATITASAIQTLRIPSRMPLGEGACLAGFALFETVDLGASAGVELALHSREADVDAAPARCDQVDEQREVVDARVPFRQEVGLETLETANRLSGEPAYLGQLLRNGSRLRLHAVANRFPDLSREGRLELSGALGELLDLRPRPLESRFHVSLRGPASGRVLQPLSRPCDGRFVHGWGR
jgi:hypothetical protein